MEVDSQGSMQGIRCLAGPYSEGAASHQEFTGSIYDSANEELDDFDEEGVCDEDEDNDSF